MGALGSPDQYRVSIEHCIIGETFSLHHPPILGAFCKNEKNMLFIDIEQAISQ